jgi:hypothetical protein
MALICAAPGKGLARSEDPSTVQLDWRGDLDILHDVTPHHRYVDGGPLLRRDDPEEPEKDPVRCDSCGEPIEGSPAGSGLFLWTRGDEVRYEEPPLCERCAYAIAVGGTLQWEMDEEG